MAINPYISSANVFVYPCANRKEGFWESKLATEYSLRTLIPWKITKPSFVITGDAAASNLEFVINGYYFNIKTNWRTAINPTSGQPLWAHIRLANKPLTSTAEGETTTILVNYEDGGQILDEGTFPNCTFKGVRFDSNAGTEATNYYHLQILDEAGNFLHRDMIKINCDDPLEQDEETGLLSLNYGNGLTLNNNTLITNLGNGLEFGSGTDGEKPIQIKLATNSGLTRDTNGLKVINAVSDPVAANNILQSLKINNVTYTIPQGKTYTAGNGIQINSNNIISAKGDSAFGIEAIDTGSKIILADGSYTMEGETKTVYSGLQFAICTSNGESYKGLQIKLADSSGLDTTTKGLKINLNNTCGLTVDAYNFLALKLASSGGLQKNNNGLSIKLPTGSGLTLGSGGLKISQPLPEIGDSVTGKFLKVTSSNTIGWTDLPSDYKTITDINSTSGGTNLTSLTIGGTAYKIPSGGGGTTYQQGDGISITTSNSISTISVVVGAGINKNSSGIFIKRLSKNSSYGSPSDESTSSEYAAQGSGLGIKDGALYVTPSKYFLQFKDPNDRYRWNANVYVIGNLGYCYLTDSSGNIETGTSYSYIETPVTNIKAINSPIMWLEETFGVRLSTVNNKLRLTFLPQSVTNQTSYKLSSIMIPFIINY